MTVNRISCNFLPCSRHFTQEHPDTLKSLENLTEILLSRQQFAEVEQAARELFALRKRIPGAEHADIIMALEDIALSDIMQNNFVTTDELQESILALRSSKVS